jgi:hypothetical protein
LDVRHEVVRVGDRSKTRGQRTEGGDGHVIAVTSDLGAALIWCGGHNLGSRLAILVRNRTLRVAVVRLVLGTSHVLDVIAVTLLTLHDAMSGSRRMLTVQNLAQVHYKPTGDFVPFSPRRVLPRFVNPRIGSKLPGFSI